MEVEPPGDRDEVKHGETETDRREFPRGCPIHNETKISGETSLQEVFCILFCTKKYGVDASASTKQVSKATPCCLYRHKSSMVVR